MPKSRGCQLSKVNRILFWKALILLSLSPMHVISPLCIIYAVVDPCIWSRHAFYAFLDPMHLKPLCILCRFRPTHFKPLCINVVLDPFEAVMYFIPVWTHAFCAVLDQCIWSRYALYAVLDPCIKDIILLRRLIWNGSIKREGLTRAFHT